MRWLRKLAGAKIQGLALMRNVGRARDRLKEAMDIYDHIDREELRRAYLATVPRLGI